MQVEINSVWSFENIIGLEDGLYRVLDIDPESVMIFYIRKGRKLTRPVLFPQEDFQEGIISGKIQKDNFLIPAYQLVSEIHLPEKYREIRSQRFNLIKEIVLNRNLLIELATRKRTSVIRNVAFEHRVSVQQVYRILNLYWKFGQNINALIPAFKLSGGYGLLRPDTDIKRGRPEVSINPKTISKNMDKTDKEALLRVVRKNYNYSPGEASTTRKNILEMYDLFINDHYKEEKKVAREQQRKPRYPSYRTFVHWYNRLPPRNQVLESSTNKSDFARNMRGLSGKATDNTSVPGSCFELDSTPLDVYVISSFAEVDPVPLGRPTVYCIIDKESRMIVGLHVSMEYASWRAGRQALVNAFTPKKEFCARYNVQITEEQWPCHHIPQRLLCDRGEFICNSPEQLVVPLIGHLSIAPPYRPDFKGIVERRFKILNDKVAHKLKGTTLGKNWLRVDDDPRLDAVYTLEQITEILIREVLIHNNSKFNDLVVQSPHMLEHKLSPTPLNYWNIHLQNYKHALGTASEDNIRALLLPEFIVSMTELGIKLSSDLIYSCNHDKFLGWKTIARNDGTWKLKARIDHDNSTYIYVAIENDGEYVKCELIPSKKMLRNRHVADIRYFNVYKNDELRIHISDDEIHTLNEENKKLIDKVGQDAKKIKITKSSKERLAGMDERRREHNSLMRSGMYCHNHDEKDSPEDEKNVREHVSNATVISILKKRRGMKNDSH